MLLRGYRVLEKKRDEGKQCDTLREQCRTVQGPYHGICIKLILEVRYMNSGQAVMTHNPELKPYWVYAEWRATVDYMVYGLGLRQTWGKQWRSPCLPPASLLPWVCHVLM